MFMQDLSRLPATAFAPVAGLTSTLAAPETGLISGTQVETSQGWADVRSLRTGDLVQTVDGGLRPVRALSRHWIAPDDALGAAAGLVLLPGGAFGNCADVALLPTQPLLIALDEADNLPDALFALIPASALLGVPGVRRLAVQAPVEVIRPVFDEAETIWAATGLQLACDGVAGPDDFHLTLGAAEAALLLARRAAQGLAA
ncbi:MAG: Hint domain-containing protein [Pseudorhodobacter sp.]